MKIAWLCLAVVLCVVLSVDALAASEQDAVVEFEGRYWTTDLEASVKVVTAGIGETFNLKNDLGVDDEDFPEGRFIWHTGPNSKLRLSYTRIEYEGDQVLTRTIDFDGKSYTAGSRVTSDLELQYCGFGWVWQFVHLFDDRIKLGTVLEAKGLIADVSLDAPSLAISESANLSAGLPVVGLALDVSPFKDSKFLSFFAEASGMSGGSYGHFIDAEAGVKLIPVKFFSISGGYRVIDVKVKDDPDLVDLRIKGPFAAATLRF